MFKVNMYLDVSIRGIKKTLGWYGYLVEYTDSRGKKHIREDYKMKMDVTPNMAALMAFIGGLDYLGKASEITVFTDNAYLRENFAKNLDSWRENGWMTAHGEPIRNKELWCQIAEKTSGHVIAFDRTYHHEYKNKMVAELARRRMENV